MMAVPSLLKVENLNFRYRIREDLAIKDINLEMTAGKVVLIAGASGCGKTTLIRCINGLIPRSYKGELSGRILVKGEDLSSLKLAEISQKIGTVLQDPERQILGTKVINEVAFGLENLGMPRDEILKRVNESLDRLKILTYAIGIPSIFLGAKAKGCTSRRACHAAGNAAGMSL